MLPAAALFTGSVLFSEVRRRHNRGNSSDTAVVDGKIHSSHEDPSIQGISRREAHAPLCSHVGIVEARKNVMLPNASPYVQMLNGDDWNFCLFPHFKGALTYVMKQCHEGISGDGNLKGPRDELKSKVPVPGNWQLRSDIMDSAIYTNIKYIIPINRPHVPTQNPTGVYYRTFKSSQNWTVQSDDESQYSSTNRRVFLHFAGVDSCFYLYLNGQLVGFSKDSRLPAEFDVRRDTLLCSNMSMLCNMSSDIAFHLFVLHIYTYV